MGFAGRGVRSWKGMAVQPDLSAGLYERQESKLTLERVEENVKTSRDGDFSRAGLGVVEIDNTKSGLERAGRDTGLE